MTTDDETKLEDEESHADEPSEPNEDDEPNESLDDDKPNEPNDNVKNNNSKDDNDEGFDDETQLRRSFRLSKPVNQYVPSMNNKDYNTDNLVTQVLDHAVYDKEYALMMVKTIMEYQDRKLNDETAMSFAETYSLAKGMKVLGKRGEEAAFGEVDQLHKRGVFNPIDVSKLLPEEKRQVPESLIFLQQKHDGSVKG